GSRVESSRKCVAACVTEDANQRANRSVEVSLGRFRLGLGRCIKWFLLSSYRKFDGGNIFFSLCGKIRKAVVCPHTWGRIEAVRRRPARRARRATHTDWPRHQSGQRCKNNTPDGPY